MKDPRGRSKTRLLHISAAIDKISKYTVHLEYKEFLNDSKCIDAVLFQLSIIGEAIIHVENDILEQYEYPWHTVRAQRNVIAHEYFGIKMDKIWSVIKDDLPGLKAAINEILKNEFNQ